MRSDETIARGLFGWHTVPRGHADMAALDVLADLFTLGLRSRLWDALVELERVATGVEANHEASRLAGQFLIQVETVRGASIADIERILRGD